MTAEIVSSADHKMDIAFQHAREEFAAIRTGRAHPAMFSKLSADYYGSPTPIQQLVSFQVPEARTILITPYDRGSLAAIERAIRDSATPAGTPTSSSTRRSRTRRSARTTCRGPRSSSTR